MILGDRNRDIPTLGGPDRRVTLDDLFRRAVERRPNAVALIDPPDRESITDGAPHRLSFAQADQAVSAIAAHLRSFELPADSIVGLQLPNTVESVLAFLGILRAGLIAAPLPLLWRQAEASAALGRVGARALIASSRIGTLDGTELAMQVAADTFAIRFVCAFGADLPDGIIPLNDVFEMAPEAAPPPLERQGDPVDHVAAITFDVTADGIVPVARNHAELLAGGCAVLLEAGIEPGAAMLGAVATGSFAGLATTIVPWLISGGTLALHQPFDPAVFVNQCASAWRGVVVVPGPLASRLMEPQVGPRPAKVLGVWRTPERLAASAAWTVPDADLTDVAVFGEIGLIARRRDQDGKPVMPAVGRITAPHGNPDALLVIEVARAAAGNLGLRGPMVPRFPFPPGAERGDRHRLKIADDGFVDTGYACRIDNDTQHLTVSAPPAGIVTVGGYRFVLRDLQDLVARIDESGSVATLPDALAGQRLAGFAHDREGMRQALLALGANPLLVSAFRARRNEERASAA